MVRDGNTYRAQRRALAREMAKQLLNPPPVQSWIHRSAAVISTAGAALVVCLVVASLASAGVIDMTAAFIALAAAWLVAVLTSAFSQRIRELSARRRIAAVAAIAVGVGAILLLVGSYEVRYRLELTSITPGNLPAPASECKPPSDDAMAVFLGSNVSFVQKFPHTVIAIGSDTVGQDYPMFRVDRDDRGNILIQTLRVFNAEGKLITTIDHNELFINSNFRSKRPDSHTLIAYDDQDTEVLFLHFVNAKTIVVKGIFQRPPIGGFVVSDRGIQNSSFNISRGCIGYVDTDFAIK